jgi:hypothetical protein
MGVQLRQVVVPYAGSFADDEHFLSPLFSSCRRERHFFEMDTCMKDAKVPGPVPVGQGEMQKVLGVTTLPRMLLTTKPRGIPDRLQVVGQHRNGMRWKNVVTCSSLL